MAATRLIPLHAAKGHTVAQSLGDRTDYAKNPEKTEKGELVTAYGCDPFTVDEEFMLQKRQYEQSHGRQNRETVIAYQIRQSFKPGEITPEEANRLGHELALRFTKPHYITMLKPGRYTLREELAPDGYLRAEDVKFTVEETGDIQKVYMKDAYNKVQISKTDMVTKKELPGAKLTVFDSNNETVAKWTSGKEPHMIEKLRSRAGHRICRWPD